MAILAMEIARTDNYGEYDSYDGETVCPVCGAFEPEHYYINDDEECIGCSECVRSRTLCIDEKSILNEKEGD